MICTHDKTKVQSRWQKFQYAEEKKTQFLFLCCFLLRNQQDDGSWRAKLHGQGMAFLSLENARLHGVHLVLSNYQTTQSQELFAFISSVSFVACFCFVLFVLVFLIRLSLKPALADTLRVPTTTGRVLFVSVKKLLI